MVLVPPKVVWPVPPFDTASVPVVSEIAIPKDEVANWSQVFPAPPIRREDEAIVERLVPPRVAARLPLQVGVRVNVPEELVIESPMLVSEEVASVMAPVCAEPNDCWSDATPLLIEEVATPIHPPLRKARTWPAVPA